MIKKNGDDISITKVYTNGKPVNVNSTANNAVFSSDGPFGIGNDEDKIEITKLEGGKRPSVTTNSNLKITSINNCKTSFVKNGYSISSVGETNVCYGQNDESCLKQGNFLDIEKDKLTLSSNSKNVGSGIELKEENIFTESNQKNGYVKLTTEASTGSVFEKDDVNQITLEKDRVTVVGNGEIINGANKCQIEPEGSIFCDPIADSVDKSVPMKIYSSKGGKIDGYFAKVGEDGTVSVDEVGLIEKGRYVLHRGGLYEMSETDVATKSLPAETMTPSGIEDKVFSGYFDDPEEKVKGFTVFTPTSKGQMSNNYRELGTMRMAETNEICNNVGGIYCLPGSDLTRAVREMYSGYQNNEKPIYVVFTTNLGKYSFGDKSLAQ